MGHCMPDDTMPCIDCGVVILAAEDDAEDTIRPRLEAAGADLDRIAHVEIVRSTNNPIGEPFCLPDHLDCLEEAIDAVKACLVIFDPITAFFSKSVDYSKDTDVRRILHPLKIMAARKKCGMVYLRHLNKSSGSRSLYRGGGSIAFVGAARSALLVARDPDNEKGSVLSWVKGNLTDRPPNSLRFGFHRSHIEGIPKIDWRGESQLSADELLESITLDMDTKASIIEAVDFLQAMLASGPRLKQELVKEAKTIGISKATLNRAASRLGITSRQTLSTGGKFQGSEWSLNNEQTK
jgi:hypothetical protein